MLSVVYAFLSTVGMLFRSRLSLQAEIIALRHQLTVYRRSVRRPQIRPADRLLWSLLSRHWTGWKGCAPQKLDRGQLDPLEAGEAGYGMIGA
jgi:hypothetical protein